MEVDSDPDISSDEDEAEETPHQPGADLSARMKLWNTRNAPVITKTVLKSKESTKSTQPGQPSTNSPAAPSPTSNDVPTASRNPEFEGLGENDRRLASLIKGGISAGIKEVLGEMRKGQQVVTPTKGRKPKKGSKAEMRRRAEEERLSMENDVHHRNLVRPSANKLPITDTHPIGGHPANLPRGPWAAG